MNKHLQKIISDSKDISAQAWMWFKELSRTKQAGVIVVILLALVLLSQLFKDESKEAELVKSPRMVEIASVTDLANGDTSLPLLGTVTSTSEATIRAESSGKLTRVYKKLGDNVVAGQVIAEFENSGERASVLQAEGSYDAAKAARDIARINSGTTNSSLLDAKTSALNTLGNAFNVLDDAIRVKTDGAYTDPRTDEAKFAVLVPDSALTLKLEAKRKSIETMLVARDAYNRTLTIESDLLKEFTVMQTELQIVKTYLDDMATAYSKALPDTVYSQAAIDAGKSSVSASRSAVSGTIASVAQARTSLNASIAANEVAGTTSGGSTGSQAAADANVKQAEGAYNAALSRLEKTIIRSPISGTLNSLSINTGDFISAFTEVAVVSNNGALEVVSYVTEDDAKRIAVGNNVTIDNSSKGVITRIASAIDPRTKKIEVRVGITEKVSTLVNGQSVRITVTKSTQTVTATSGPITIPLSALKLTPNGAFVFTLSATSSLVAIPVTEGAILGEEIQVLSGLSGSETIVIDARGLKADMAVTVKE